MHRALHRSKVATSGFDFAGNDTGVNPGFLRIETPNAHHLARYAGGINRFRHAGDLDYEPPLIHGKHPQELPPDCPARSQVCARIEARDLNAHDENTRMTPLDDHRGYSMNPLKARAHADDSRHVFAADHECELGKAICYQHFLSDSMIACWHGLITAGRVIEVAVLHLNSVAALLGAGLGDVSRLDPAPLNSHARIGFGEKTFAPWLTNRGNAAAVRQAELEASYPLDDLSDAAFRRGPTYHRYLEAHRQLRVPGWWDDRLGFSDCPPRSQAASPLTHEISP
jgi:hypothetical protein